MQATDARLWVMEPRSLVAPPPPTHQTMSAQPALVSRATFTKEKIALLCLMNMVFERHSQDRNIPFEEIAARTKLPVDQVYTNYIYFEVQYKTHVP